MPPRYAAKRDANEREIIDALEAAGYEVWQLEYPDLLTHKGGVWTPLEVKNREGRAASKANAFTKRQQKAMAKTPIPVVYSIADALREVGARPC